MANPNCAILNWDSAFFAKRIARVGVEIADEEQMDEILAWCTSQQVDCLYYLCRADHPGAIRAAENGGFRLVDIRAELNVPLTPSTPAAPRDGHRIRPSTPDDLEAVTALAGKAFQNTRFSNDPEFGPGAAARLYTQWIKQNCESQTTTVLVSVNENRVNGFISLVPTGDDDASIGLIAVDDKMRGRGVGRALVEASKDHCRQAGIRELSVVTQASNTAALRLYEECGFRLSSVKLWYHKWFSVRSTGDAAESQFEHAAGVL